MYFGGDGAYCQKTRCDFDISGLHLSLYIIGVCLRIYVYLCFANSRIVCLLLKLMAHREDLFNITAASAVAFMKLRYRY